MTVLSQNWTAANCDSLHYIVAGSFFTPAVGQRSAFLSGALLLHFQESCSMFCKRQRTATLFSADSDDASNVQLMRCNGKIFSNLRRKHHPTCAEKDKSFGKFGGGGHKKRARATSEVFFFHMLYAVIHTPSCSHVFNIRPFLCSECTQVNKVLLLPSLAHKSAGPCPHPLFVVFHALRNPDDNNHSAYSSNEG